MRVLLTGGSGNLGQTLVPKLLDKGDTSVILDVRAPPSLYDGAVFIEGSILDRSKLTEICRGCGCIVHIAAWHGIHEDRGEKDAYDFFDLNVRGTFEVFEAAASAGIGKVIFIAFPGLRYANALARQLVAAGLAHRPMVIRYHGLAGTMICHSFHTAAISMSMEWANSYASRSTADVRPVRG